MIKIIKNFKINLIINAVFKSKRNFNDKRFIQIQNKDTTDIDEILDELIKKCLDLTESLKIIDLIPEGIESIIYNFTEIIISNTFIESPQWIKNKKCTINPQNNDNKCFLYSIAFSLNYQNIKNSPERISKIKPFINSLNWDNINFPPKEQDYKNFEMNNKSTALNVLHTHCDGKISHLYKSEFNKTREKNVILLTITDGKKQHYLAANPNQFHNHQ